MIRLPDTLTFRLAFWYTLVVILLMTVAFSTSYLLLKETLERGIEEDLLEDTDEFRALYQKEGLAGVKREVDRDMESGEGGHFFFQLFDSNGARIYTSDLSSWKFLPEDENTVIKVLSTGASTLQSIRAPEEGYEVKTVHAVIAPGILMHFGESTEEIQDITALLPSVFAVVLLLAIPLASLTGLLMARRAVKGIKEVSRIAAEIEKGRLERRVSVASQGEEIQQLANTFNAMLDRIWVLVTEMREMTDNIAHDLRGPLARIRMITESILSDDDTPQQFRSTTSDIIEECDRLLQMINSALDVAEAEAGAIQVPNQKVDISQLVRDACELFEPMAEEKSIDLSFRLEEDSCICGNIHKLQRMIANLLDNALKYTEPGGRVDVTLNRAGENIEIRVLDTGVGIPEDDQARVFDRFFRCDQSRTLSGCGLGLSYSRAVARSHGGDIVVSSSLEKGSCFAVTLPAA